MFSPRSKCTGLRWGRCIEFVTAQQLDSRIIVVSGDARFDSVCQMLKQSAYDFLRKPYPPDELLNTMKNISSKELEHDSNRIGSKLQESEYLYHFIVGHSPDIVLMLDSERRFTFLNDAIH